MTNKALDIANKYSYLYVDIINVASGARWKYTNWATPADGSFTFEPKLGVKIGDNVGTLESKVTQIDLPYGDAFTTFVTAGDPLPPLSVTITERIEDPFGLADATVLTLFKGRIAKISRNPNGLSGAVRIECLDLKGLLAVPLGLPCTQQCVFTFGGVGCEIALTSLIKDGTCAAIGTNRHVTITGLPTAPDESYWRFGYVTRNGLSIVIRDWSKSTDATDFVLRDRPPSEWIGHTVLVTPGCDKSYETCRDRWLNQGQFGGYGIGMPDYMPNIETG